MFDVLENNSGKICIALVGTTLAGGAILVFGAPAFAAAYISLHAVEILTIGAAVGAAASGASYVRRESTRRLVREQANNGQENLRRSYIGSDAATVEQIRGGVGSDLEIQTQERISATEADISTLQSEVRRLNGLYRNLSCSQAQQVIADERRRYEAGDYSDSDSSSDESKQALLSERNMFQRPVSRTPMEIAANDESQHHGSGVVHRRRASHSNN